MSIPTLWVNVQAHAVTPFAVLQRQAAALGSASGGLLEARVATTRGDKKLTHALVVRAPSLREEFDVVRLEHRRDEPFPVAIVPEPLANDEFADLGTVPREVPEAERRAYEERKRQAEQSGFTRMLEMMDPGFLAAGYVPPPVRPQEFRRVGALADTYDELLERLKAVLGAPPLSRKLNSLIARSNAAVDQEEGELEGPDADEGGGTPARVNVVVTPAAEGE